MDAEVRAHELLLADEKIRSRMNPQEAQRVAAGVVSSLLLARVIRNLPYGVTASAPLTFVVVSGILVCTTLGACYVPARRAARVDPIVALRDE